MILIISVDLSTYNFKVSNHITSYMVRVGTLYMRLRDAQEPVGIDALLGITIDYKLNWDQHIMVWPKS